MSIEKKIRLNAFNKDDLKIFSFLCQDAIISKEEIFYDKATKLFVATLTRYCWEKEEIADQKINYRVVTGLQIKNIDGKCSSGWYYKPTVIEGLSQTSKVNQEEKLGEPDFF